jgi:L-iditol 2-dehydrogenase
LDGRLELCDSYREIGQAWQGGFAEYLALPAECVRMGTIQKAPQGLDPAFASITEPISSCVNAQEKGHVGLGDTVVIIGSGPVGCTHVSLARARGASRVYIADLSPQRLALCEAFQPDATIDASHLDLVAEVRRLTSGRGADVIVTANPAPVAQIQAVEMARKGGRILLFGGLPKDQSKPGVDMNIVHYNALHMIGTTTFAPRHQRIALDLVASGRIPADKLVTQRLPLAQFHEGAALAMQGQALKVVFFP